MKKHEWNKAKAPIHASSSWIFMDCLNVPNIILGDSFIAVNKDTSSLF